MARFLLSDRLSRQLNLRTLSNTATSDVQYANTFPLGYSGGGAMASVINGDGSLTVYQLMTGVFDTGVVRGGSGFAFNDLYSITFPSGGFFPNPPTTGLNYSFVGRFADGSQGTQVPGRNPLSGVAFFDGKLYFSGTDEALQSTGGSFFDSFGSAIFEGVLTPSVALKPMVTFGPNSVQSITAGQGRGALFAALGRLDDPDSISREAIVEVDPRINHLVNVWDGSLFVASADTNLGSGVTAAWLTEKKIVTGMTHDGVNIIASIITAGPNMILGDSDDRRLFVTANPFASGGSGDPIVRRIDLIGTLDLRGITAIGNTATAPAAVNIAFVDDGRFDAFSFDPLFSRMSYSVQAAVAVPLVNAVRDLILFQSQDFVNCQNNALLNTGTISSTLASHANQYGGIGRTVYDLTSSLAPTHPCYPDTFPRDDYTAIFKNTVTAGNLAEGFYPQFATTSPLGGTSDLELEVGLASTTQNNDNQTLYYMAGGELDVNNAPISARNELFIASRNGATGIVGAFATAGLVQTPSLGGVPAVLTGLAVLDGTLYAARSKTTFSGSVSDPRIVSIDPSARIPMSTDVMDIRMFTKALASSDLRGSVFAAGLYDGTGTRGNTYSNLALWEIDPRNKYVKNTWWGQNGDFNATANTVDGVGFSTTAFPSIAHVGDAATVGRYVVISADVGFTAPGGAFNSFYITVNPDASGAVNPFVARRDTGDGEDIRALTGNGESVGFAAPPVALIDPGPSGIDNTSIDPLFAQTSYSARALQSGLIRSVYEVHFLATSANSAACQGTAVFTTNLPAALAANAGKTSGIGRTTFDLRNPLTPGHPCGAPAP